MSIAIIVEGKNDKTRLKRLLTDQVLILCTYGSLNTARLEDLKKKVGDRELYLFTDNDSSGKKIRAILRDTFPDAEQIYTRRGYAGVEGTPEEYLLKQLLRRGRRDAGGIFAEAIGKSRARGVHSIPFLGPGLGTTAAACRQPRLNQ